ncbi:HTH-type transcriptional regulator SinR [Marinomonas gallaica]|uniref:HTH-type transcriptional regulator SinR n=1 Tax=Marinomonas gallaica TaxID=1806667 RepID=A0A1C3JPM2_9GAMM|nr:helix-turn-helix transcriptional regulator [Marinomonas gallaica]SBT17075.1 HTH-type transcriptional regulator SinR [Marinomonas gallaica]SBT20618.1 HTH-type transcriptional regulator SinR [Marinomonas gallaica]
MENPNLNSLGHNLKTVRLAQGLSLSQLASNAGIAKSNLSRIEQGEGNPTIETIWRLAVQLNIPFGDLIAGTHEFLGENGIQVKLIDQGSDDLRVDVYWMSCAAHTMKMSEAHTDGTTEQLTLISGELFVGPNDALQRLTAGDTYTLNADQPHCYQTQEKAATLMLVIKYPNQKDAS